MRTQTTPGSALGGRGVDRDDPPVGDRAPQHLAVQHPRDEQVADELRLAAQLLARVASRLRAADVRSGLRERPWSCGRELGDGLEDPPVPGAAAEVPGEVVLDLLLAAELAVLEQSGDGQQHARRAEAALQRGVPSEGVLESLELGPLGETLRSS